MSEGWTIFKKHIEETFPKGNEYREYCDSLVKNRNELIQQVIFLDKENEELRNKLSILEKHILKRINDDC